MSYVSPSQCVAVEDLSCHTLCWYVHWSLICFLMRTNPSCLVIGLTDNPHVHVVANMLFHDCLLSTPICFNIWWLPGRLVGDRLQHYQLLADSASVALIFWTGRCFTQSHGAKSSKIGLWHAICRASRHVLLNPSACASWRRQSATSGPRLTQGLRCQPMPRIAANPWRRKCCSPMPNPLFVWGGSNLPTPSKQQQTDSTHGFPCQFPEAGPSWPLDVLDPSEAPNQVVHLALALVPGEAHGPPWPWPWPSFECSIPWQQWSSRAFRAGFDLNMKLMLVHHPSGPNHWHFILEINIWYPQNNAVFLRTCYYCIIMYQMWDLVKIIVAFA